MEPVLSHILTALPLASAAAGEEEGGSFLVTPGLGLMIWTLVLFGFTFLVLKKFAFPKIGEALDKRAATIRESLEAAEKSKEESDKMLADYRQRLTEAREQADEIGRQRHPRNVGRWLLRRVEQQGDSFETLDDADSVAESLLRDRQTNRLFAAEHAPLVQERAAQIVPGFREILIWRVVLRGNILREAIGNKRKRADCRQGGNEAAPAETQTGIRCHSPT